MKKTDIYSYYAFGYNYYLLSTGRKDVSVRGSTNSLEYDISIFFQKLAELDLKVTEQAADDLHIILEEIESIPEDVIVDEHLSERVKDACAKLDATLDSELKLRSAFIVTPKRFDINHLLNEPWNLLSKKSIEESIEEIPNICRFDFTSGCRCVAFGLGTAAVFHFMRCIEGELRHYYCQTVKQKRVEPLLWGPMVDHLRRRRKPPPKPLLDHLDNIRLNFRNPTQHPDARYDID